MSNAPTTTITGRSETLSMSMDGTKELVEEPELGQATLQLEREKVRKDWANKDWNEADGLYCYIVVRIVEFLQDVGRELTLALVKTIQQS